MTPSDINFTLNLNSSDSYLNFNNYEYAYNISNLSCIVIKVVS